MPVSTDLAGGEQRPANHAQDRLAVCGKMGELILSLDWSESPLGPIDSWPQSLCTTVSLCLASNFPISLAWGAEHTQIYNEGYAPICGDKHPQAIGQNFSECWASAWPVIGEAFELALAGQTSFLENQRIFLDRNGYLEETFFTFSFSPIRDENGVAGLFHPVTETTARMLSERRTHALRELAARSSKSHNVAEACTLAIATLADYRLDLPVLVLYLFDEEREEANLACCTGLMDETSWANPKQVTFGQAQTPAWPLEGVYRTGTAQHVEALDSRFGHLACGEYPESLKQALILPLTPPGCTHPLGALVAGVSPRLPLNEAYRGFYDLLANGVTGALANARAFEQERRRAEALAEIDRAKTRFFSNVSHEFRTPLTLMLGPLEEELAEQIDPLPVQRRQRLEGAHRNGLRLLKLVNNLLDFSRIEAGRMEANFEATDLASYTAELASVFRSAIEKAGLTLTVDCPPLPEPVFVDRGMWEKIVLNLISNALKHTFTGSIAVHLKWCGDRVELAVTDTGVGIAAAEVPHLFERFHRVTGGKSRSFEGTGIGLALVRELTEMHGGTVDVQSREDYGSTFTINVKTGATHLAQDLHRRESQQAVTSAQTAAYVGDALSWLPRDDTFAEEPTVPVSSISGTLTAQHETPARRPLILLVDDNPDMRDYVTRLLAGQYEVLAVKDGLQALASARASVPDLVLTDVMMPGLDGFGLLRALRADSYTQRIPVVFVSARAGQERAVEGLNAGADDYLAKPFSAQELLARVHTHLEQSRIRRAWANELEQSNKELETFSYSVSHDLRAPLRALDGFSKLLLEEYAGRLDEQGCRYLERVRSGAQTMSVIINSLLSLSRVSRGVLRKQPVDISELVRRILAGLQRREPSRTCTIEVEAGLVAEVDRRLMTIAFLNLLDNAWKYTAQRSSATIAFGHQVLGRERVFFVRDNGSGFAKEYTDRLFKPFQRMDPGQEFSGAGIGLATVHRVIVRHGGRIWAESAVDAGATFYFTLGEPG